MDRPLLSTPANESISSIQTTTSENCQASTGRHRGRASVTRGSSQRLYCGDHTLLVSRNAATTRNISWATRGRRCEDRANQAMARHERPNRANDSTLRNVGESAPGLLSKTWLPDSVV